MVLLRESCYPSLIEMIDSMELNTLFARSVLTKDVEGTVYADDGERPTSYYIAHSYGMTLLFGDSGNEQFCADLRNHFRGLKKDEWLQAYPDSWYPFLRELAAEGIAEEYSRLNFTFDPARFQAGNGEVDPAACGVERTPVGLIGSLEGTVIPRDFWAEGSYSKCVGFTAFVDGEPASTAFAAYLHGDKLEMGIETAERYRGKGLAKAVSVALIRYCLANGLTPDWSCRYENTGSVRLAEKLGFVQSRKLPYLHIAAKQSGA